RPFLAWTQLAHARLLLTRDAGARRGEAAALLTSALATARELGMDGLVAKVRRLGLDAAPTAGAQEPADGEAVFRNEGGVWDAVLDHRARADYRERLAGLHRELEDAERCNDEGRVARARAEFDFIAGELASAFGLGGRGRRAGSPIERARKAVASRIRFSLAH